VAWVQAHAGFGQQVHQCATHQTHWLLCARIAARLVVREPAASTKPPRGVRRWAINISNTERNFRSVPRLTWGLVESKARGMQLSARTESKTGETQVKSLLTSCQPLCTPSARPRDSSSSLTPRCTATWLAWPETPPASKVRTCCTVRHIKYGLGELMMRHHHSKGRSILEATAQQQPPIASSERAEPTVPQRRRRSSSDTRAATTSDGQAVAIPSWRSGWLMTLTLAGGI
jgi:hypothetical protein